MSNCQPLPEPEITMVLRPAEARLIERLRQLLKTDLEIVLLKLKPLALSKVGNSERLERSSERKE